MDFVKNLEVTHIVGGGEGGMWFDTLRTKIDMWLTPYILTLLLLLKKWSLAITI